MYKLSNLPAIPCDLVLAQEQESARDSLSTKRDLQRKLKPNVTQISQPMTDGGVANSPLFIGFQN